ncbi:MAG: autotransporter domain-containing protein [Rhodospirillaceae bacterium]
MLNHNLKTLFSSVAFAFAVASANAVPSMAQQFSGLYVFGDSLSDSGNAFALSGGTNPPSPPYFNGRVSNGPVWVESFAPALGLTYSQSTNFAIAGAEAGSLNAIDVGNQVLGFVGSGGTVPADALTVVWAGNNDFLRNAATTPSSVLTANVVTSIGTAIGTLNAFGAQNFLIPNLPKFGSTPGGASTGLGPQLNQLASFYNTNLHETLIGLESSLGVNIFIMDIEGLFDDVIANPSVYGLVNVTIPCLDGSAQPTGACPTSAAADATLFWDAIHPTAAAHSVVSQFASATLAMFDQPRVVASNSYMGPIILEAQRQGTEQRLMTVRSTSNGQNAPANVYVSYRMGTGDRDDRPAAAGFDYDYDVITLGIDKSVGSGWVVGASVGLGNGEVEMLTGEENEVESLMASAYVSFNGESGVFIDLAAGVTADDYDTVRDTSFAFRPTALGETSGTNVSINADVGYTMEAGGFRIGPFAGVRYVSSDISAYEETGAEMLNLTVLDQRTSGIVGAVGFELGGAYSSRDIQIIPTIRVAYETELDSIGYGASIQTSTGQIATIGRGDYSDNRIVTNAGLALVGNRFSVSVSYQGTIDYSDGKDEAILGRLSYAF